MNFQPTARDWPEDSGHENGNYRNTCAACEQTFTGHERRVVCHLCDDAHQERWNALTPEEQQESIAETAALLSKLYAQQKSH